MQNYRLRKADLVDLRLKGRLETARLSPVALGEGKRARDNGGKIPIALARLDEILPTCVGFKASIFTYWSLD
ncbi:hypothetical protein [Nostoc sp.]|uniref:hypothetical protein n=1 Tax=Nostoc sp. TaxID=1180 RepID=UPI002A5C8D86|nr:hypothetical protein [Nostoc sp. S13]